MSEPDFTAVNGFDPDTFLYGEEPILAEKLKKLGKYMYFYPHLRVNHLAGAAIKNAFKSKVIRQIVAESNCVYYRKYLKSPAVVIALYKFLVKFSS
ncbi:MAG: hypothetical protein HDS92_03505 [Bacteroidales bacterium]|nr:hypothetical protein [Bacteroidales bacterium]